MSDVCVRVWGACVLPCCVCVCVCECALRVRACTKLNLVVDLAEISLDLLLHYRYTAQVGQTEIRPIAIVRTKNVRISPFSTLWIGYTP